MPKIQEFKKENYNDADYKKLIETQMLIKIQNMRFHGASIVFSRTWNDIKISNEDLEIFKQSNLAEKLLIKQYNQDKKQKIDKYTKLKAKLDHCLYDVKSYIKLIENIDAFTYCGATREL